MYRPIPSYRLATKLYWYGPITLPSIKYSEVYGLLFDFLVIMWYTRGGYVLYDFPESKSITKPLEYHAYGNRYIERSRCYTRALEIISRALQALKI